MNLVQLFITGILVGGVYGLIAMGFVIVYRSSRVFNMAYGQFAALGAFMAWTFAGSPDEPRLPIALAVVLTALSAIVLGLFIELVFFRRMIGRPESSGFILSLGLFAFINSALLIIWGPSTRIMSSLVPTGPVRLGEVMLSREHLLTFLVALSLVIAFGVFFKRTRLGLAIRASYQNQVAARCLGVSARLISQIAWCLCLLLATAGGVLLASVQGASIVLGDLVMVTLAIVLLGGMDSLTGCVAGGLVLAIGENLVGYYLSSLTGFTGIFPLMLILLILILRPTGLFGTKPVERV